MRETAYETFRTGRFPADAYMGGKIFTVDRDFTNPQKLICKIHDRERNLEGTISLKASRIKNMTFREFCQMLDIMEARTMKPIAREQEQEAKER